MCFVSTRLDLLRIVFLKKKPIIISEEDVEAELHERTIVVLMRVLDVVPSGEAVDSAFDATWRVGRRGGKVEIEVHLFLKSL